jgi:hypothetical protein
MLAYLAVVFQDGKAAVIMSLALTSHNPPAAAIYTATWVSGK